MNSIRTAVLLAAFCSRRFTERTGGGAPPGAHPPSALVSEAKCFER